MWGFVGLEANDSVAFVPVTADIVAAIRVVPHQRACKSLAFFAVGASTADANRRELVIRRHDDPRCFA